MQIKLTWKKTNDIVLFDVINEDVAQWFVACGNDLGSNRYSLGDQIIDQLRSADSTINLIKEEKEYISMVNQGLSSLKMPLIKEPENYFDQKNLNTLHKDWAETREKWPKLTELFFKIDRNLYEAYQEMNCHIHQIERSFEYRFRDNTHWRTDNPFKYKRYDWEVCHLFIEYPGHGRHEFEKFQWMDTDDDMARDNCNWDNIDSFIGINLVRPYHIDPPKEFLIWCEKENLVPWDYTLPLANVTNWRENLTKARQVFTENVTMKENYFTLEIIN